MGIKDSQQIMFLKIKRSRTFGDARYISRSKLIIRVLIITIEMQRPDARLSCMSKCWLENLLKWHRNQIERSQYAMRNWEIHLMAMIRWKRVLLKLIAIWFIQTLISKLTRCLWFITNEKISFFHWVFLLIYRLEFEKIK